MLSDLGVKVTGNGALHFVLEFAACDSARDGSLNVAVNAIIA